MEQDEKNAPWEALKKDVEICQKCGLCKTRTNTVFGRGSTSPRILFVGEAPGEQEDLQGKPFVGPAGKLLDDYLTFLGLEEEDYYIANILKCRPPRNRNPLPEEEEACIGFLRSQVLLLKPKMIVCLGKIAASRIIQPDFKITKQHGMLFRHGDRILGATYHPSALLRDPSKRADALLDLKKFISECK